MIDDDVAVCTCLIVVAVANATATLKAIVSAIKTNFGPILRPPRSISTGPTYGRLGRLVKSPAEIRPDQDGELQRYISLRLTDTDF